MQQRHKALVKAEVQEQIKQRKKFHEATGGKYLRNCKFKLAKANWTNAQPTEPTSSLPLEVRGWSCPYCDKGLPVLKRRERDISVMVHLRKEHGGTTLVQCQRDRHKAAIATGENRRKYRETLLKKGTADMALQRCTKILGPLGHDIQKTPFVYKNVRGQPLMCRRCRISSKNIFTQIRTKNKGRSGRCEKINWTPNMNGILPIKVHYENWIKLPGVTPEKIHEFLNMQDGEIAARQAKIE